MRKCNITILYKKMQNRKLIKWPIESMQYMIRRLSGIDHVPVIFLFFILIGQCCFFTLTFVAVYFAILTIISLFLRAN